MYNELDGWHEALRRSKEPQDSNFIVLDCGHEIFADPRWNEIALDCAIQEHYKNHCYGGFLN